MKKYFALFLVLLLLPGSFIPASSQRKKVGVVLSGGGAKGVAHISVLRVIEEAGIPIDYIAGTSMGAIVGGLYAIGYDPDTLDSLVRTQNWTELLSDRVARTDLSFGAKENDEKYVLTVPLTTGNKFKLPSGFVGGNNIYNLLTELTIGYHDSIKFADLPIPFACVAYDMVTGQAITLDEGNLATALRASMSIPGAFEPVRMDGMVLVDGGISNNFPANILKDMGADIIIGVDVSSGKRSEEELSSLSDILNQITYFTAEEAFEKNIKLVDLYVKPDIRPYNAASFSAEAIDTLLMRGNTVARENWDNFLALRDEIGEIRYVPRKCVSPQFKRPLQIRHVSFEGLKYNNEHSIRRICGLRDYSILTPGEIQNAVARLQGTELFSDVNYRLDGDSPYDIVFRVKEKSKNSLSIGLRFDTEEMAAILLNASLTVRAMSSSYLDLTGRLSENPYAQLALVVGNETTRNFNISYRFKYNDINQYDHGNKVRNLDFGQHRVDANFSNIRLRNFKVTVGLTYDYYRYQSMLSSYLDEEPFGSQGLISYYADAHYETMDRKYYPRKGLNFKASYRLYTSDFATYKGTSPFSAIKIDFQSAISMNSRVTFLPAVFGRVLIGNRIAFPASNFMGGTVAGRYFDQQLPFIGIRRFESFENSVLGVRLDIRGRLWKKNYISVMGNYARHDDDFFKLFQGGNIAGVGLQWSYSSIIGPVDLLVDYSNRDKSVGVYFNFGYYF